MFRIVAFLLLGASAFQAQDRVPVLVELFTSEGCSSCPPADKLLAQLESTQPVPNVDLIVLSEHVDYWNSMGWRDPFSSALFSQRQQSYASRLRLDDVYTPQAVIDGHFAEVGSNRPNLLKAITESGQASKSGLEISVRRDGDTLVIDAPQTRKGTLWVAVAQSKTASHVLHGENSGRMLEHVGVVRSLTKMTAGQATLAIDHSWGSDLRVVAFVQDDHSGRILQAVQKQI